MTAEKPTAASADRSGEQSPARPEGAEIEIVSVPVPIEEIGPVWEYDGSEDCEYGCGSPAEYHVEVTPCCVVLSLFGCEDCLSASGVPLDDVQAPGL